MLQQSGASLPTQTDDILSGNPEDDLFKPNKKGATFDPTASQSTYAPDADDGMESQSLWSQSTASFAVGKSTMGLRGMRMETIPSMRDDELSDEEDRAPAVLRADAPAFRPTPGPPGLDLAPQKEVSASREPMYLPTKKELDSHKESTEQPRKVEQQQRSGTVIEPSADLPSVGSAEHDGTGKCRPCAWFWKPQSCENGKECRHCHICPEGEIKARKMAKVASLRAASPDGKARPTQSEPVKRLTKPEWKGKKWHDDWSPQKMADYPPLLFPPFPPMLPVPVALDFVEPLFDPIDPADLPSHGSMLHGVGRCKPCAWFWKPSGCKNGKDCCHCHICPEGEIKARKNVKVTAMRMGLLDPPPAWVQPFPDVSLDPMLASH